MAQILCRNTFLDVLLDEEERAKDLWRCRARSETPRAVSEEPADWAEDWAEASVPPPEPSSRAPEPMEFEAMGSEANQATSSNLGLGRPIESGGLEGREGPLEGFGALSFEALSPGSVGHPVLCKRPCVHVIKGNPCPDGDACAFCHHCHRAAARPSLQQRTLIKKEMPPQELLGMVSSILQEKARKAGTMGTEPLFGLLEVEMQLYNAAAPTNPEERRQLLRGLRQFLRRLSFSALVAIAVGKTGAERQGQLIQEFERLRVAA